MCSSDLGIPGNPANSIPPETIGAVAVYRVMFGVFLFHSFLDRKSVV